jgi:phosphoserine phosphatase
MCGEMVTMHRGLTEAEVQRAAFRFFEENFVKQIFPEMRALVQQLQQAGCVVWAVSSTNEWVIRAAMPHFGIPEERVLGAAVRVVDGVITDQLLRVPSGEGKPRALEQALRRAPDAAFGNSMWDAAMLGVARHPFVINPTAELEKIAGQRRWPVYRPADHR